MTGQPKHNLPEGATIRQLRPSELPLFREHLLSLDAASRRDRFNGITDDDVVAAYADRCFRDGAAVIGFVVDGHVRGAAELHERPELPEPTGEIAFSVEREFQHGGIGARLFARLIESARGLGYQRLLVTTHPENEAMKALARRFNSKLTFSAGETLGLIELAPETSSARQLSYGRRASDVELPA